MQLVQDDAETNPTIPPAQLNYVRYLTDTHKQYTRFFDALLVPRPSHAAFFRDLKGFRSLPTTIKALTLCDPTDESISKDDRKEHYRDVTTKYLGSRFAHPWCRKAMAGTGNTKAGGWWGAEWAATGRKMSRESREQEDKLHKLLIPLWISFRSRMFPGREIVEEWWEKRQLEPTVSIATTTPDSSRRSSELGAEGEVLQRHVELRMAKSCSNLKHGAAFDDEGDEDDDDTEVVRQQAGAAAATGLFRLAAAGMIINSMPKMQQWKLKRELKKRSRQ